MTTPGPLAKLQRSFAYRVSKWFPSEMLRWMDRISGTVDNLIINTGTTATVPTYAALRAQGVALVALGFTNIIVETRATPGDQAGGDFVYLPGSLAADNDGTLLVSGTFRFERTFTGAIDVIWFGATGDGVTDDRATILAALAVVSVAGGSLYFPGQNRNYKISDQIAVTNYTDLAIYSDGNALISCAKNKRTFFVNGCTNLKIWGLHLNGTIQVDGGDPLGGNIGQSAIYLATCNGAEIFDNKIANMGGYGTFIGAGNSHIDVHHNIFDQTMAGVQTAGGAGTVNNSDLRICDNTFIGFIPTGGAGTLGSDDQIAVFDGPTQGVVIARNFIDKRGVDAGSKAKVQATCIDVAPTSGSTLTNVLVEDNICVNCYSTSPTLDRPAIDIFGAAAGTIRQLTIKGNIVNLANAGIYLQGIGAVTMEDVLISNNQINNIQHLAGTTPGRGIGIVNSDGTAIYARITVDSNMIDTVANDGVFGAIFQNNIVVRGNTIVNAGRRAIELDSMGTDVLVAYNQIFAPTDYGIVLQTNVSGLRVIGNSVFGGVGNEGFYLTNISDGLVLDNSIISSVGGNGFFVSGCTNCTVKGNIASLCAQAGIDLVNVVNGIFAENNFHDNTQYGINFSGNLASAIFVGNLLTGNALGPFNDISTNSNKRFIENPQLTNALVGNNRGTVSITGVATTSVVTFTVAEPDANYFVELGDTLSAGAVAGFSYITNKTVNGFTINISAAPVGTETHRVDWFLTR